METIAEVLKDKMPVRKRSKQSTNWQVRGCEIAGKLGSKRYSVYIKLYKYHSALCEEALAWVSDYPRAKSKEKLFLWWINKRLYYRNKEQETKEN